MGFIQEFKQFAAKGNVIDLAVGIIIGGAFGKIVTSLVNDILMPPLGLLISDLNFKDIKLVIKSGVPGSNLPADQPVSLNIGNFIQSVIDFVIVAFAIFVLIKLLNRLRHKQEAKQEVAPQPAPEVQLLGEIRDLLKNK